MLFNLIISPLEIIIENLFSVFHYNIQLDIICSIFFISFAVTMMCLPFYYRADKIRKEEEEKFSELKPYVDKIKKNFKGDEQFFMLQTLYRQHNYNPVMALRNTFSLLLQIPFFIAAYHFFSHLDILNGYSWGPIQDFSRPDSLFVFNGLNINVLPVLMTVVNIISCEVYLSSNTLKARIQPYSFALIFLILLYDSPSGLVLYWTFNNFFYLLKNLFMESKPKIFISLLVILTTLAYLFGNQLNFEYSKILIRQIGNISLIYFCIFIIYLIIKKICNLINNNVKVFKISSKDSLTDIFFLCCFGIILLQSVIIPVKLLTSDLTVFTLELDNTSNIIKIVLENISRFLGLYLFWGIIVWYLIKKEFRVYCLTIIISLFLFSLFNYLNFDSHLGFLDFDLVFADQVAFKNAFENIYAQMSNLLIFFIIFSITIFLFKKFTKKTFVYIFLTILLSEIIVSTIYLNEFVKGLNYIDNINKSNSKFLKDSTNIELSKTGKNVIIIFLDRFSGGFLPMIIDEKPELKKIYSGFTFYPNTVSFYGTTILGYPPCVGGYEYTPYALDKDERKFSDKWLEASLMLLTLFKNNNYISTVLDPVGISDPNVCFYENGDFTNIYTSRNINYIKMDGKYSGKLQIDESYGDKALNQILKKLYMYTFFYIAPKIIKTSLYDKGDYLLATNMHGPEKDLINSYASLAYLANITNLNSTKNTFTLINNELPHVMCFLQYPNYEYSQNVTNNGINKFDDEATFKAYHSSMASILLVGKYLDFLKKSEVYDNTRIIIISDHGNNYINLPHYSKFQNKYVNPFNPLFMVKDFNQNGEMNIDNSFMTNADVPFFSTKDLIENAINPFTGKKISIDEKSNGANVYMNYNYWNASQFKSNKVILDDFPKIKHVNKDIFDSSNWNQIKYNRSE